MQVMAISIWRSAQVPMTQKRSFHFYARLILTFATRCISPALACDNHPAFVEIDLHRRSKYCLLNYETRLEARNDSWTFETVRATHHTPPRDSEQWSLSPTHKYAFEAVLSTEGLMQVGWVSEDFGIDPEGGTGVGDDAFSYGYDGCRVKKWHKQDQNRVNNIDDDVVFDEKLTCVYTFREKAMVKDGLLETPSPAAWIWIKERCDIIKMARTLVWHLPM